MACEAESLTIGTKKAFDNDYPLQYEKRQIAGETIYICNKGSDWSRRNEVLLLRCEEGTWIAYDGAISADLSIFQCRQQVFRCLQIVGEIGAKVQTRGARENIYAGL